MMKTIIFSGPSINSYEINCLAPEFFHHYPAKCGDILRTCRLKPEKIILIDGSFESSPSVWHKEILFAIDSGVEVYGASSMGALRAAELSKFGMIGHGEIYSAYLAQEIIGDDEVSLLYSKGDDFLELSTPLINAKITIKNAIKKNLITASDGNKIINHLHSQPYYARNLSKTCDDFLTELQKKEILSNYINQKKIDAIELINLVKSSNRIKSAASINKKTCEHTLYFKRLYREIASTTFNYSYQWLPQEENILFHENKEYGPHLTILARTMNLLYHLFDPNSENLLTPKNLNNLITKPVNQKFLTYYLILNPNKSNSKTQKATIATTNLLELLLDLIKQKHLTLDSEHIKNFLSSFRRNKKILTKDATLSWFKKNGISQSQISDFLAFATIFHQAIMLCNFEIFGSTPPISDGIFWLKEAYTILNAQNI